MYFKTQAVILAHRNFAEADKILTIFTKDHGKISTIAKGIRRPTSRKSGHLEIGNWCKMFVAHGKNFDLITETETIKAFGIADFNPLKANRIYHLLELVESLTAYNQKNEAVFELLVRFLQKINQGENFDLVSSAFKIKLLNILGLFSTTNIKTSQAKEILAIFEKDDFQTLKEKIKINKESYLRLLTFLDMLIENFTQQKIKTTKFLNG